ncbi:MAG: ABC transporter ATP-binding protein [Thermoprotei archaeon]|nr:MAG: ABC transporter ATP-binding protein [Thermoprotei archaeon]RLF16757.1 MAG: ABC transporter ATP-binding protein [Thermoprotei archaeon]
MYYLIERRGWVKAVDRVSFHIDKGEALGLVGESGCGKSSLGITILRILPYNARILGGKVILEGRDVLSIPEEQFRKEVRWKKISMVFQGAMNALNPVMKIGDQIAEAIMIHENVSKKEAIERVKQLLKLVGIDPSRVNHYPHEFSGGMRQRAMIAMALACNPALLIADEPTTALDVIVQAQVLKLIRDIQQQVGISTLLVTHDLSIVAELCDKVAVMYAGKIVEYGSTNEVYYKPRHPYTYKLLGAMPSVKGKKRRLEFIPGAPPDLLEPPPGCRFHPRCPYAIEICSKEEPTMQEVDGVMVACHRAGELWN